MNIFRFLDWTMYADAKKLNQMVNLLIVSLSYDIKNVYGSQFARASLSVCLNSAEGAWRYSDTELCRYLDISLGSLSETVACADILMDKKYITEIEFQELFELSSHLAKQIQGMQNSIKINPRIFKRKINYSK